MRRAVPRAAGRGRVGRRFGHRRAAQQCAGLEGGGVVVGADAVHQVAQAQQHGDLPAGVGGMARQRGGLERQFTCLVAGVGARRGELGRRRVGAGLGQLHMGFAQLAQHVHALVGAAAAVRPAQRELEGGDGRRRRRQDAVGAAGAGERVAQGPGAAAGLRMAQRRDDVLQRAAQVVGGAGRGAGRRHAMGRIDKGGESILGAAGSPPSPRAGDRAPRVRGRATTAGATGSAAWAGTG